MKITLSPAERSALRARAHHLHPVVMIGSDGLTPAVLHEIDVNLTAHELIKVRVFADERGTRDGLLADIAERLDAAPIQHIGKLLVLYRPQPEVARRSPATPVRPAKKTAQREQRPRNARHTPPEPAMKRRAAKRPEETHTAAGPAAKRPQTARPASRRPPEPGPAAKGPAAKRPAAKRPDSTARAAAGKPAPRGIPGRRRSVPQQ